MRTYLILTIIFIFLIPLNTPIHAETNSFWQIQSVDTMKYSRDLAREKLNNKEFDKIIDLQVADIAAVGSTYIAIDTPYDEEFSPFLRRWISAARKYNLKVWFRGNFSGWEGWFGYPKINRAEHIQKTTEFIEKNPDMFNDGDIFSSCPECENGGPGDPRETRDVEGYRNFLINEYRSTKSAFQKINKKVNCNYFSMNGDVATLIMDKPTTLVLDGIVTVDHYVASPDQLVADIHKLAQSSGGKIVLGEFGVPIPDIHGSMTDTEQASWIESALFLLAQNPEVVGINYWVNQGGSTQIWQNGKAKPAVGVLENYFKPKVITGQVTDELLRPIAEAKVILMDYTYQTGTNGKFTIKYSGKAEDMEISASGYALKQINFTSKKPGSRIILTKINPNIFYRLLSSLLKLFLPR